MFLSSKKGLSAKAERCASCAVTNWIPSSTASPAWSATSAPAFLSNPFLNSLFATFAILGPLVKVIYWATSEARFTQFALQEVLAASPPLSFASSSESPWAIAAWNVDS